ncbi:putative translation factor (SUA5) [Sphaerochaeta pleomorpha str. Grapes]|uniref:L-threonylcarbamoyladenylate synthase n=1 Tax=Sphaerochaeta pleomorpha (strain ATCC BAA-1885 / DSM 22778 / Grapes) TaxID=158190 RepID=G8QW66_SPHPG|nr:L-threonylcarbamoyladenylate synthase [Sphaerochaeta pleomorpha]AEV28309.1 putative translation factor (SUA5) [Sphaerochaeta pleomorpha str. Grapes]
MMSNSEEAQVLYRQVTGTVDKVVALLQEDKVLVLPCDTIYGLCAKVGPAEEALRNIKYRAETKPFLLLATLEQAKELCTVPEDIESVWPCSLTAILWDKQGGKTAIRVPADAFLQQVLTKLGKPIYSTSVNESGYQTITNITDIIFAFKDRVPAFVVGSEKQGTVPSTLIDCTVHPYALVRMGSYDASNLLK